jgi:hypothetical protein
MSTNTFAAFYTVPDPDRDLAGYIDRLREIAIKEKIDLFIPVAIEVFDNLWKLKSWIIIEFNIGEIIE